MPAPDRVEVVPRVPDAESPGKFLSIASNIRASIVIDSQFYYKRMIIRSSIFVIAIDTEKVLEAGFSGLNTRVGDLLTVKFKYNTPAAGGAVAATRIANLMHIVLRSDHILEIHDTGVRVFD